MKKRGMRGARSILLLALILILAAGTALAESVYAFEETYVRSVPGNTGNVLATMKAREYAQYLDESQIDQNGTTWYYVSYGRNASDVVRGWVSDRYARLSSEYESPGIDPAWFDGWPYVDIIDYPYAERVVASNGGTYIRSGPSTDADDLGGMKKGGVAAYLGLCCTDMNGREWYRIDYNGIVGWVSARYTELQ